MYKNIPFINKYEIYFQKFYSREKLLIFVHFPIPIEHYALTEYMEYICKRTPESPEANTGM